MRSRLGMCGAAFLGLVATAVSLQADEEKIPAENLPAAVKKAVKKKFSEARIRGAAKEVEDGVTTYEVELNVEGRSVDLALKADGTILEIEKEVPVSELPKAVRKKLAARYPGAKIEKAEEIIKGEDGPVRYEVAIKAEVVLTAKGKIVKAEEEDEDDDRPSAKAKKKDKDDDEDDDDEDDDDKPSAKVKKKDKDADKPSAKAKKRDDDDDEDDDHN
jgi:hypothetical protein